VKLLVTGGAGFIGSQLVERRLAAGDRVTVIDDFNDYYDPALKRRNVSALVSEPRFTSHAHLSAEARASAGIPDGFLRLSIGIESAKDLIRDLEQALH